MPDKIPVSVIVTTKNEEKNLARCLAALENFDEIIVVDSQSTDRTRGIAESFGMRFVDFAWNGQYPKKRQWCLDMLPLKNRYVFFVDADEVITSDLAQEISKLDWSCAGYFVKGAYVINGKPLKFGLRNKKLCLFDRIKIEFPVVDDLDMSGMGEIEGHYQPVFKQGETGKVATLKNALWHYAMEDDARWHSKHEAYAQWETSMRSKNAYPSENDFLRRMAKKIFMIVPFRAHAAFAHSYIFKGGILDGCAGFTLAKSRFSYYKKVGG